MVLYGIENICSLRLKAFVNRRQNTINTTQLVFRILFDDNTGQSNTKYSYLAQELNKEEQIKVAIWPNKKAVSAGDLGVMWSGTALCPFSTIKQTNILFHVHSKHTHAWKTHIETPTPTGHKTEDIERYREVRGEGSQKKLCFHIAVRSGRKDNKP